MHVYRNAATPEGSGGVHLMLLLLLFPIPLEIRQLRIGLALMSEYFFVGNFDDFIWDVFSKLR